MRLLCDSDSMIYTGKDNTRAALFSGARRGAGGATGKPVARSAADVRAAYGRPAYESHASLLVLLFFCSAPSGPSVRHHGAMTLVRKGVVLSLSKQWLVLNCFRSSSSTLPMLGVGSCHFRFSQASEKKELCVVSIVSIF